MSDGHRPHRFPRNAPAEVEAWKCQACGKWVNDGDREPDDCPVDWRSDAPTPTCDIEGCDEPAVSVWFDDETFTDWNICEGCE